MQSAIDAASSSTAAAAAISIVSEVWKNANIFVWIESMKDHYVTIIVVSRNKLLFKNRDAEDNKNK